MISHETQAWARLAARVADALMEFAAAASEGERSEETEVSDEVPAGLGERQRQAYEHLLAADASQGVGTGAVSSAINYDFSNTYMTLRRLQQMGLAELVPGSKPQRWRVQPQPKQTADPYVRAAEEIGHGEWTTYGDISIAIRGNDAAAIAVGRAAATLKSFPNPHRVMRQGGVIPPTWHSDSGGGPEECRALLDKDGVRFINGRADPSKRVGWHELRERLRLAGVHVPPPTAE